MFLLLRIYKINVHFYRYVTLGNIVFRPNQICFITQTSHLNLGCDARIYAIFRLCLKLCFPHPFSGTVPTYMLLVAVLGSKRPRQVPTATCVPYKGCGKYSLFHNIEIAYILAISFISKCEV